MIDSNSKNNNSRFPKSVFYTSRQEFTDSPLQLEVVSGKLPPDIYGHLFLVAPVGLADDKYEDKEKKLINPTQDGTPLFNGDGMVYRLDFDEANLGKVKLSSSIAKTPCFYTDEILEKPDQNTNFKDFINLGLARLSLDLGFRNQVNTAIIPMKFNEEEGYRLMMTWDAGRPYEIDPVTLELVTAVGSNQEWDEQVNLQQILEVVNTASHPAFDPYVKGGELFTVSFQKSINTWLELIINKSEGGIKSKDDLKSELKNIKNTIEFFDNRTRFKNSGVRQFAPRSNTELNKLPPRYQEMVQEYEQELQELEVDRDLNFSEYKNYALNLFRRILDIIDWVLNTLLEVSFKMDDRVKLIRWDGESKLKTWKILGEDGKSLKIPHSMHQIAATQDYIILADTVFKVGPEQLLPDLLPNLLPDKLPKLLWIIRKFLKKLNKRLRELFSYPQSEKTDLYIIRRAELDPEQDAIVAKQVSIDRPFPHFMADYDNSGDRITLHVAHNTGWDASSWVRPYDSLATKEKIDSEQFPIGMTSGSTDLNSFGSYVIDLQDWDNPDKERVFLKGKLLSDKNLTWMSAIATYHLGEGINLPQKFKNIFWISWGCWSDLLTDYVVDLYEDYEHREIERDELLEITRQGVPANLCRVDLEQGEIVDSYKFEPQVFANSPQFVPRQLRNQNIDESIDGYIVCVVNIGDSKDTASEFHIFDAADLKGGAICKLKHDNLKLGITLHSAWCPQINKRRATYKVDARQDYQIEQKLKPEVGKFFQEIIKQHFPDGKR